MVILPFLFSLLIPHLLSLLFTLSPKVVLSESLQSLKELMAKVVIRRVGSRAL